LTQVILLAYVILYKVNMSTLEEIKTQLLFIKDKLRKFENIDDQNNYLDNYQDEPEILELTELVKKLKFEDLNCKVILN
jgi:hypothetical protein